MQYLSHPSQQGGNHNAAADRILLSFSQSLHGLLLQVCTAWHCNLGTHFCNRIQTLFFEVFSQLRSTFVPMVLWANNILNVLANLLLGVFLRTLEHVGLQQWQLDSQNFRANAVQGVRFSILATFVQHSHQHIGKAPAPAHNKAPGFGSGRDHKVMPYTKAHQKGLASNERYPHTATSARLAKTSTVTSRQKPVLDGA
eukprot:356860-Amphidinium_carterae.1